MSTTLPSLKDRVTTVREMFLRNQDALKSALPRHMTVDRMLRVAFTCINTTPKLLDCSPRSLLAAVMQCAQLGLEPGILGHAYLIPFENRKKGIVEVQILPGYRGLIKLARNTGEVSTVFAESVYKGDRFTYQRGTDPKIEHVPDPNEDVKKRGEPTHYYAVMRMKDGGVAFEVMTRQEIELHRDKYSRAAKNGPWVTEFDEMAKKTVLRRVCKVGPQSIELQTAVMLDDRAEVQLPQELPDVVPPDPDEDRTEGQGGGSLDRLTDDLKNGAQQDIPA